jgi:lipid II isoglutaminyl synthase (glutamine-hydrolysing)
MKQLSILHLYPNELNTYGDHGNALVLSRRIQWHGYEPMMHHHHPGAKLPTSIDIVIGGGGQDSAQSDVQTDILKIGEHMHRLCESGTPMLVICGSYQLFGHRYKPHKGAVVKGIGVFNAETIAGEKRMIGNVKIKSEQGLLFGFENHSGQTFLDKNQPSLGTVMRGGGNNGQDKTEGARTSNTFGTYLHGPFLPNNPSFCDELIRLAAIKRYGDFEAKTIDDCLSEKVRSSAKNRTY